MTLDSQSWNFDGGGDDECDQETMKYAKGSRCCWSKQVKAERRKSPLFEEQDCCYNWVCNGTTLGMRVAVIVWAWAVDFPRNSAIVSLKLPYIFSIIVFKYPVYRLSSIFWLFLGYLSFFRRLLVLYCLMCHPVCVAIFSLPSPLPHARLRVWLALFWVIYVQYLNDWNRKQIQVIIIIILVLAAEIAMMLRRLFQFEMAGSLFVFVMQFQITYYIVSPVSISSNSVAKTSRAKMRKW